MKNVKTIIVATVFASITSGAFAADLVNIEPENLEKIGVVSAGNANSLSSLEEQLKEKADAAGAASYRITSTSGQNKLHGTAVIYK
ncbi:YdgH/BhsA/McbA-like domain containing protein [Yersinia enterocolitica]